MRFCSQVFYVVELVDRRGSIATPHNSSFLHSTVKGNERKDETAIIRMLCPMAAHASDLEVQTLDCRQSGFAITAAEIERAA